MVSIVPRIETVSLNAPAVSVPITMSAIVRHAYCLLPESAHLGSVPSEVVLEEAVQGDSAYNEETIHYVRLLKRPRMQYTLPMPTYVKPIAIVSERWKRQAAKPKN